MGDGTDGRFGPYSLDAQTAARKPPARRHWLGATLAWAAAAAAPPAFARPPDTRTDAGGPGSGPADPLPGARPAGLAVALGSGSRHGLVHVGVIRALRQRGVVPDLVTGTSAGAIAGSLWAAGLDAGRIAEAAASLGWLRGLQWAWPRRGLLTSHAVADTIRALTADRPIEQWPVRFAAVATDLRSGRRIVLDRGPGGPAVAASACVPALYAPVRVDGRDLVDGSLVEPVPVRTARELGAARVIAIDIAYRPWEAPVSNPVDAAFQAMHIAVNALIAEQLREADLVIRLDVHRHFLDGSDPTPALTAAGERAVAEHWHEIQALSR